MDNEQLDDVKELVLKLAAITGRIDQHNSANTQHIASAAQDLGESARRLQTGADQFANAVMQAVGKQVHGVIAEHSAHALDQFNEQLRNGTGRVQWATEALAEQRKMLHRTQRALVWQGLLALLIGSVLAAGAGGYLLWQAGHVGGDAALAAEIRQAIASGALARCNTDHLCARTVTSHSDARHPRNQYVIVQ